MKFKNAYFFVFLFFAILNLQAQPKENGIYHPSWIQNGNIYEVNIRQYTPQGTFIAFEKHLPRLKKMGVKTLWFMPIYPIGEKDRKGSLGSYYAVKDYKNVNPEFGNLKTWIDLVRKCHAMGFKVILDWVANHTSTDNGWLVRHPDFYQMDSLGHPLMAADWSDTKKLNYQNNELSDTMINCMQYWLTQTDIDGFRCDVAGEVPDQFWIKCIKKLREDQPNLFMLAEGDKPSLAFDGFNATYTWNDFDIMKKIAAGQRGASSLDTALNLTEKLFPKGALRMFFTSNHDENSWNKADYGTMPGAEHAPFSVLTMTLPRSIPLIYSGQEEPNLRAIRFFDKDTIIFRNLKRALFYTKLLQFRSHHPALDAMSGYTKIKTSQDDKIFAFIRYTPNDQVLVVTNLSGKTVKVSIESPLLKNGIYEELFTAKEHASQDLNQLEIKGWGFEVFSLKK